MSCLTTPKAARFFGEPFFRLMGMRGKDREFELAEVKKVLVVRIDGIGDVVLFTPFLRELRRNMPDAWITLIVTPSAYNLVELCPYVNEVLTFGWITSGQHVEMRLHKQALKLAWNHLWNRHFDLAINPRWDADYFHASFVAYFSGAPWRVGYSENVTEHKSQVNRGYDILHTHLVDNDNTLKHEVERNLDMLRFLGGKVKEDTLELWASREDEAYAEQILKSNGVQVGALIIAFVPGAGHTKRMWPLSNFIELGAWLKKEYDAYILVMGGREEEPLGQEIRQRLGDKVIDLADKTTLRQAGALMKHCRLFVGNDSGTMHLAAAADIPVVEISCHPKFGSPSHANSPLRFGPWRVPSAVLQPEMAIAPCSVACIADQPHCINGITVERVKETIRTQLRVGKKVEG